MYGYLVSIFRPDNALVLQRVTITFLSKHEETVVLTGQESCRIFVIWQTVCVPSTLASGVQTVDKEAQQMVQKLKAKSTNMKSSSTEFFIYQQQKTTERSLRVKQPNTIVRLDEVTFCGHETE